MTNFRASTEISVPETPRTDAIEADSKWLNVETREALAWKQARDMEREIEACNDDWNKRYQEWAALEEKLHAEIKGLRGFKASVDEALNMGDGTYKP